MKYLLASIVLLSGCASFDMSTPIVSKFPNVPTELLEKCSKLTLIDDGIPMLSSVIKTTVKNYSLYHECAAKQELWIEWYNSQKNIHEDLKK